MLGDLLGGVVSKILLATTLLFLSVAGISTYLYLGIRDELTSLQSKYTQLESVSKECISNKAKNLVSAEHDDKILVDRLLKIDALNKDKQDLQAQLKNIPKKSCQTEGVKKDVKDEIEYVDIDAPFDDDYKRVFQNLGHQADKGSSNTSAR